MNPDPKHLTSWVTGLEGYTVEDSLSYSTNISIALKILSCFLLNFLFLTGWTARGRKRLLLRAVQQEGRRLYVIIVINSLNRYPYYS